MPYTQGDDLKRKIQEALNQWHNENPSSFNYNQMELHRRTGISRPSLHKYRRWIDVCLEQLPGARANWVKHARELEQRAGRLAETNQELEQQVNALRNHVRDMYKHLYEHSVDLKFVLEPVAQAVSVENGKCILCGALLEDFNLD